MRDCVIIEWQHSFTRDINNIQWDHYFHQKDLSRNLWKLVGVCVLYTQTFPQTLEANDSQKSEITKEKKYSHKLSADDDAQGRDVWNEN